MIIIILSAACGVLLLTTLSLWFMWLGAVELLKGMKIALKDRGISLSEQEMSEAMAKLRLRGQKWNRL